MPDIQTIWQHAIEPANLPWTILLGVVTVLGFLSIFSGLDLFDFGGDVDVDVDADADAELGGPEAGGCLSGAFSFMNLASVPISIVGSIATFVIWTLSMIVTALLAVTTVMAGLLLLIPLVAVGLVITKLLTKPLVPVFKSLRESNSTSAEDVVGKTCQVISSTVDESYGRIEVAMPGAPLLVNARTEEKTKLEKGDEAVVLRYDKTRDVYIVAKADREA